MTQEQKQTPQEKWRAANPEKARAASVRWAAENPERVKAKRVKWQAKNRARINAARKQWALDNPDKIEDMRLRRYYGISLSDFRAMSEQQGHVCLICKKAGKLVVDHCHKTGIVRGLLCAACNKGLGFFRDNPDLLLAAAAMLVGREESCLH